MKNNVYIIQTAVYVCVIVFVFCNHVLPLGRYHAVQLGIKNKTKENISFLMNLMDVLEKVRG